MLDRVPRTLGENPSSAAGACNNTFSIITHDYELVEDRNRSLFEN